MKNLLKIIMIVVALLSCKNSFGTDLRGQVVQYSSYNRTYVPLQGIRVDIWIFNGSQWLDWAYTSTGPDGMYYFLRLNPGVNFQIQINGRFCFAQPLFMSNVQLYNIPQIIL